MWSLLSREPDVREKEVGIISASLASLRASVRGGGEVRCGGSENVARVARGRVALEPQPWPAPPAVLCCGSVLREPISWRGADYVLADGWRAPVLLASSSCDHIPSCFTLTVLHWEPYVRSIDDPERNGTACRRSMPPYHTVFASAVPCAELRSAVTNRILCRWSAMSWLRSVSRGMPACLLPSTPRAPAGYMPSKYESNDSHKEAVKTALVGTLQHRQVSDTER